MKKRIDARGLSCPMPVIMVQKEIKKSVPDVLEVLVDNRVAVENVTRFARSVEYAISCKELGDEFVLVLTKRD